MKKMAKKSIVYPTLKSRCISDPTLSDIDSKNKMAWVWSSDSGLLLGVVQIQTILF